MIDLYTATTHNGIRANIALFPVVNQRRAWVGEAELRHLARWADALGACPGVIKGLAESS